MLLPIFILYLSHLVLAYPVQPEYNTEDIGQLECHFNDFKLKYNKSYTATEEEMRLKIFKENLVKINELNRNTTLTVYGINKFTDWTAKEMENMFGFRDLQLCGDYGSCSVGVASDIKTGCVSGSIDWRSRGAVTPVQNQGQCGSCWAFSSAAVLEGAYFLKHKTLLKVSEQQFVDCDKTSLGCRGGYMHQAITSTMQLGGQELESDYPYIARQQQCLFDVSKAQVKATGCKVYPEIGDSDGRLESLLATAGPLSIALDADNDPFRYYKGGIINKCANQRMNHGVTLVGSGEEGGVPFWIIKNSWGSGWGEGGYVRVKRGEGCLLVGGYVLTADVA